GVPPNPPPLKTFLGSPIRYEDEALGSLYLTEKAGGEPFTPEDERLLALFTGQAALAIRNARLFIRERGALAEAEVAQKALAQSEARYRAILDNTTAVIYVKDTQGHYTFINHQYEALFHINREEIKSKTDYDIFPKETAKAFRAHDQKVLQVGAPLEYEEIVPHDEGPHTYISLKFPLYDATGTLYAVCGISTDITERKGVEEELRAEHDRLETLVHTSPVGVFVADAATRQVLLVNQEVKRILGLSQQPEKRLEWYEQQVVYRRADGSVYPPEDLPLQRALARGETVRAEEIWFEFPDGRSVPTLVNATPVYSAEGEITAAIAVIQDLTPLEELEKLRSEFLGMVSHELKTPLTAIKGSAATVLGSRRPFEAEETRELFEIIDEQADRLRDLVDNLLDMTRIEAGSLSISTEAIDLQEVLEEAQAAFVRGGSAHQVLLQSPEELPTIQADRRRVGQVLGNLLSNAAKFSPETAPITISAEQEGEQVTVHVRDQGRGIPPEKLPHLFKKFSRLDDDSRARLSGSGLGLALCKGIVEAHGGRIWADSQGDGQGSTFSFSLPVAQVTPVADTARRADHLGRVRRTGERTRILVVDDEPQVLRFLRRSLDEAGYQPIVTNDPSQVTRLMEVEEPDLVLLDLVLPGTNGFDLLQRIREFTGVPVIILTAQDESEDAVRALKLGADDYMTKPFSPSELLARIEAVLRRRVLPDLTEVRPPFELEDLSVNFAERTVAVGGQPVSLSATEYKLLYELATNAGRVLTHDQILHRVWGPEYSGEAELVRSFIRNLRRKLGDDARKPRYIFTEPQVGYRIPRPNRQ
ncbi:MAG: ATP-binding protein, partial [Dehalococcoidia bacterium]